MKRLFKKAMKSHESAEVWAKEHNVVLPPQPTPDRNKKLLFGWTSVAACLVLCLAIVLPIALHKGPVTEPPVQNKIYSSQDVVIKDISLDTLYEAGDLLLFEKWQVIEQLRVSSEYAKDDETLLLSHAIMNYTIMTSDQMNGFIINYRVRLYHEYEFYSNTSFTKLNETLTVNEVKTSYKLVEERAGTTAYLQFDFGNKEYFLQVFGFPDVTEITPETLTILLEDLIP